MDTECRNWCLSCKGCLKSKSQNKKARAPLGTVQSGYRFERIAVDILDLPRSHKGNKCVMVVTDCFTKWIMAYSLPDHKARTMQKDFMFTFGMPEVLHTDQGADFESNLMKEMCQLLGEVKTRTTPYHPQSDGQVERFNRTLISMLKLYVAKHHRDWDDWLTGLVFAYSTTEHASTGYTPHYLMLGRRHRFL